MLAMAAAGVPPVSVNCWASTKAAYILALTSAAVLMLMLICLCSPVELSGIKESVPIRSLKQLSARRNLR